MKRFITIEKPLRYMRSGLILYIDVYFVVKPYFVFISVSLTINNGKVYFSAII